MTLPPETLPDLPFSDDDFESMLKENEENDFWLRNMSIAQEDDKKKLFLRPWKTTSLALMVTFNEINETVHHEHRNNRTLKERIGSLCMDGTITVDKYFGVSINRALYSGQPIGDLLPKGQYGTTVWCKGNRPNSHSNYLRVFNKKTDYECVCHKKSDIHFSSYLTFSHNIFECNIAVMDDLSLIVLRNIFNGVVDTFKEIGFSNPVRAVCYLGNWIIK